MDGRVTFAFLADELGYASLAVSVFALVIATLSFYYAHYRTRSTVALTAEVSKPFGEVRLTFVKRGSLPTVLSHDIQVRRKLGKAKPVGIVSVRSPHRWPFESSKHGDVNEVLVKADTVFKALGEPRRLPVKARFIARATTGERYRSNWILLDGEFFAPEILLASETTVRSRT